MNSRTAFTKFGSFRKSASSSKNFCTRSSYDTLCFRAIDSFLCAGLFKTIAILSIFLLVMLPIVQAQELTIQKFAGRKGVNGVAGRDDVLEVAVLASLPETLEKGDITPDQIRTGIEDVIYLFDRCEKKENVYLCRYNVSLEGFFGKEEYKVALFTDEGQEVLRKTFTVLTDSIAPKIDSFSINPQLITEGPVQFSYLATDLGFDTEDTATCSGLKEIQFIANGKVLLTDPADKTCRKENVLAFTKNTTQAFEKTEICAKAFDISGLVSAPVCQPLIIDRSTPGPKSVVLTDVKGFALTHLKTGETRDADVIVTIESNDGDIVFDSVTADVTAFAPGYPVRKPDEVIGDKFAWRGVPISVPDNCKVIVSATDVAGNAALNKELSCNLLVDDKGPEPTAIKTRAEREGKPVLGVNGTITADFKEEGIGMSTADAGLDMRALGLGIEKADRCSKISAGIWRCFWNVEPKVSGIKKISVTSVMDDLGNAGSTLEQEVDVDLEPPVVDPKLQLRITHTGGAEYGNVTIVGDGVEVTAKGTGIDEAIGNFTEIGGGVIKTTCEGNKTLTCTFASTVQTSGPYNATLNFDFLDVAGNYVRLNFSMPVYAIKDEPNPNYWKIEAPRCSPSLIDRSTTSIVPHPVYCQLRMSSTLKNAEPTITTLPDASLCTGNAVTEGFVTDIGIINAGIGRKDPIIKLSVGPADITANEVTLNCPLNIHTRIGDFFTTNPERENVSITLEFYNLPLGELAKNVDDEVEDAIKKAEVLGDWIGTVDKIIGYAQKLCTVKSTVFTATQAIDSVIIMLTGIGYVLYAIPFSTAAGKSLLTTGESMCRGGSKPLTKFVEGFTQGGTTGSIVSLLEKFCLFATCRLAPTEGRAQGAGDYVNNAASFFGGGGGVAGFNSCQAAQDLLGAGSSSLSMDEFSGLRGAGTLTSTEATDVVNQKTQQSGAVQNIVDVKDSLIWSTLCLCVPGIFHNLNKLRQIQCRYATCVASDVKEKGIPLSFCKDSKAQQICKFVVGEIFMLFPVVQIFNKFLDTFKTAFSNPFAAWALVSGCLCHGCGVGPLPIEIPPPIDQCNMFPPIPGLASFVGCVVPKTLAKVGDAVASVQGLIDKDQWETGTDECDRLDEIKSEREEAEVAPAVGGGG